MVVGTASGTGSDPGGFVGREQELAELRRLAGATRLVTLCGAAGIGKTSLLNALVAGLMPDYPDGTFVTRLADLAQPDLLTMRVAGSLWVREEPTADLADTLAHALDGRRLVLGLDGYEQVATACAGLCERLLDSVPGLLILTAGREPLGAAGEVAWPVPALTVADAVRLFVRRAAAAAPGFALGDDNSGDVVAACRAAGGMPLAIELAAARAAEQSVAQIAAGISSRLGPPEQGDAGPASHAAAMRAAIDWSHDELAKPEQILLRRLAVSPSWTLEMAELTCADDELPAASCLGLLTRMSALALVEEAGKPGQGRWRVPRAIGEDAAARLAEAGETQTLSRRLRDYAAQRSEYLVSIAHARVPVTGVVVDELFRDYNTDARNVRAALAWCLEHGDAAGGLRICTEFGVYWIGVGAQSEGARWFQAFSPFLAEPGEQPAGPVLPGRLRGPALAVRGQLAFHRGDLDGAHAWAQAGVGLCQAARDLHYAAIGLNVLAETATATGQPEDALDYTGQALELARPLWDSWNRIFALNVRAEALTALGRAGEARESATEALALALETGHHWGTADARRRIAQAALSAGDLDTAREYYLAALPYLRAAMPPPDAARGLTDLGRIAVRQGDPVMAREYLADSLQLTLRAGTRAGLAGTLLGFAELAAALGNPGRAIQLAAAATAQRAAVSLPPPDEALRYRDLTADLGESQAGRLWEEGLRLTGAAAAQLALAPA